MLVVERKKKKKKYHKGSFFLLIAHPNVLIVYNQVSWMYLIAPSAHHWIYLTFRYGLNLAQTLSSTLAQTLTSNILVFLEIW